MKFIKNIKFQVECEDFSEIQEALALSYEFNKPIDIIVNADLTFPPNILYGKPDSRDVREMKA